MEVCRVEIPLKLPSCNNYINACRTNRYAAAKMKSETEDAIGLFINRLPHYEKPVKIRFHWVEGNKKRDLDGICFAKKFILDSLVKFGKIDNDNVKHVTAFTDTFEYGDDWKVILEIEEVCDDTE